MQHSLKLVLCALVLWEGQSFSAMSGTMATSTLPSSTVTLVKDFWTLLIGNTNANDPRLSEKLVIPPTALLCDTSKTTRKAESLRLQKLRRVTGSLKYQLTDPLFIPPPSSTVTLVKVPHLSSCVKAGYLHPGLVGTVYQQALGSEGCLQVAYIKRARARFKGVKNVKGGGRGRARRGTDFEGMLMDTLNNRTSTGAGKTAKRRRENFPFFPGHSPNLPPSPPPRPPSQP